MNLALEYEIKYIRIFFCEKKVIIFMIKNVKNKVYPSVVETLNSTN